MSFWIKVPINVISFVY